MRFAGLLCPKRIKSITMHPVKLAMLFCAVLKLQPVSMACHHSNDYQIEVKLRILIHITLLSESHRAPHSPGDTG